MLKIAAKVGPHLIYGGIIFQREKEHRDLVNEVDTLKQKMKSVTKSVSHIHNAEMKDVETEINNSLIVKKCCS